jgi:hypothetical protein
VRKFKVSVVVDSLAFEAGLLTWSLNWVELTGRRLVAFLLLGEALEGPLVGILGLGALLSHVGIY